MLAAIGVEVSFSLAGAVIAATIVGLPLFVMSTRAAFEAIDPEYERLSATLGDSPWRTFRRVTLPLALPGIAGGAVLAFARSLGEFGAVKVVSGNITGQTQTATLVVEAKYQNFQQSSAYATSFLLAAVAIACLVVVAILRPKQPH